MRILQTIAATQENKAASGEFPKLACLIEHHRGDLLAAVAHGEAPARRHEWFPSCADS